MNRVNLLPLAILTMVLVGQFGCGSSNIERDQILIEILESNALSSTEGILQGPLAFKKRVGGRLIQEPQGSFGFPVVIDGRRFVCWTFYHSNPRSLQDLRILSPRAEVQVPDEFTEIQDVYARFFLDFHPAKGEDPLFFFESAYPVYLTNLSEKRRIVGEDAPFSVSETLPQELQSGMIYHVRPAFKVGRAEMGQTNKKAS